MSRHTTQPRHDSIVDEIHATRERLAEQYQNDLLAYSQAAESHCRALGFQIVESPRLRQVHENLQQVEVAAQLTVPRPKGRACEAQELGDNDYEE